MYKRPSQPETLAPLSHSFPDQPPPPLFSCSDPAPAPPLRLRSITVLASPHCALAPPRLFVRWRLRAAAPCGGSQCGAVRGARASLRRGIVRVPPAAVLSTSSTSRLLLVHRPFLGSHFAADRAAVVGPAAGLCSFLRKSRRIWLLRPFVEELREALSSGMDRTASHLSRFLGYFLSL